MRFQPDTVNLNNGYPILSWQYIDPDAKHTVSFELSPIGSVLTWNKEVQAVSADGKYTFADVGMGQYDYSVTNEAGDYAAKSGTVTVKGKDVTERVELVQNRHKLSFNVQPENAELTVKSGTTELTAESENTYSVVNGTYTYTAELFGYKTAQGSVAVDRADKTHTVTMQAEPAVTVTFANADKGQLTVVTGERTMSPDKNGAYALPVGYRYDWTFKSANYAKQTGSIDLTGITEDGTRTVTIPLAEKDRLGRRGRHRCADQGGRRVPDRQRWGAGLVCAGGQCRPRRSLQRRPHQGHRPGRRAVDPHRPVCPQCV